MSLIMQKSIPSSAGRIGSITTEKNPDYDIKAICNNCSKRFKSMRAIAMHLKMTGARHTVNFIDYGNYNKNTGVRKMNDHSTNVYKLQTVNPPT
jgi:SAM-dependent MidA family methyltransferase